MSVAILSERLSSRALALLGTVATGHGRLAAFTQRIDAVAQHFRSLGKLSESGYRIIISLDFCELMDSAGSLSRAAQSNRELERRRVLADIGFSRAAMDTVRTAPLEFTILPGTIAEILLFLSLTYTRNAAFVTALRRTRLGSAITRADSVDAVINDVTNASGDLNETISAFHEHLTVADRLMETVEDLLTHPNFVAPEDLGLKDVAVDYNQYRDIYDSLSAIRTDISVVNNVADAVNLAVAGALTSDQLKQIVIHMTRTPSLHKLGRQGVIVDMSVVFSGTLGEFPIICRPDAVWLYGQVVPSMKEGSGAYSLVETIFRSWTAIGSYLRVLEVSTSAEEHVRVLDETFREMDAIRNSMSVGRVFDRYVELYVDSALRSEQIDDIAPDLIDRKAQIAEVETQELESAAVMREERIRSIFGILRTLRGVNRAILTSAVAVAEAHEADGWAPDLSFDFLVDAGLVPMWRVIDGVHEVVIHHPATDVTPEPIVLVGTQLYRNNGGTECTVYWPTECKLKRFLKSVSHIETDELLFLLMGFEGGGVDYIEILGRDLNDLAPLRKRAGARIIRTVQISSRRRTFTCELPLGGLEAHTSIRVRDHLDSALSQFYSSTAGDLPNVLVDQFVADAWRKFSDGNSQRGSEAIA